MQWTVTIVHARGERKRMRRGKKTAATETSLNIYDTKIIIWLEMY